MKLPKRTLSRSSAFIDAAVLYIYGNPESGERVSSKVELARMCGLSPQGVAGVIKSDKWEKFRLDLIAEKLGGELAVVGLRSQDDIKLVLREKARLESEIPVLELEAKRVIELLVNMDVGEKEYKGLLQSLERIELMLERRTGKKFFDECRRDILKLKQGNPIQEIGGKVIEI